MARGCVTFLVLVIVICQLGSILGSSDYTGSRIVPPLYSHDNLKRCQRENSPGTYCFVKVLLESDGEPVRESARIEVEFRRNLLNWGLCLADCLHEVTKLSPEKQERLFVPKFEVDYKYIFPTKYWNHHSEPLRMRNDRLVNICVNNRLERNYNLTRHGYSEIEYCTTSSRITVNRWDPSGLLPKVLYVVIVFITGALCCANLFDLFGSKQLRDSILVSAFSIRRNWNQLTDRPKSVLHRDFAYIDGLRVWLSTVVLAGHCLMIGGMIPLSNPEYAEKVLRDRFILNFATSPVVMVQIFFAISGMLLTANVLKDIEHRPHIDWEYFWAKIGNRLIRILPVYLFFILVSAVGQDIPGLDIDVVGYKTIVQEQARCRNNWWMSVLFVSNLHWSDEEWCLPHGWYLSADQQLFIGALMVLAVIWMYPQHAKIFLQISLAVAVVIPCGITYYLKLESAFPVKLSELQLMLKYQPWIRKIYTPGYNNANSYIAGMVVGYLYHQRIHNQLDIHTSQIYKFAKRLALPVLLLAYLPSFMFYEQDIPRRSWWSILHSLLYRNAGVFYACVYFVDCFQTDPGPIRRLLSSKFLTVLGKLSYSVYVCHFPLLFFALNWLPADSALTLTDCWLILTGLSVVSYLTAFVVYFCIEQPAGLLLKHWLLGRRKLKMV